MRKPGRLCSILVCIPSLPSHFPDSGQKHGDSRVVSQVLRVKKAQLTVTEMPGCGAAHRGQGQGSAEQLRGGGAGDPQGWITNLCMGPWPFSASSNPRAGLFLSRTDQKTPTVMFLFKNSRDEERSRADTPRCCCSGSCACGISPAFCFPLWTPPFTQSMLHPPNHFSKGTATWRSFGCDALSVTIQFLLKTGTKIALFSESHSVL